MSHKNINFNIFIRLYRSPHINLSKLVLSELCKNFIINKGEHEATIDIEL